MAIAFLDREAIAEAWYGSFRGGGDSASRVGDPSTFHWTGRKDRFKPSENAVRSLESRSVDPVFLRCLHVALTNTILCSGQ